MKTRDVPAIPPDVSEAARAALRDSAAFRKDYERTHADLITQRGHAFRTDARVSGELLFDWALDALDALPREAIRDRFGSVALPAFRHETTLADLPDAQGGPLVTELHLNVYPEEDRLFDHHEWFRGFRTAGGGALNTPTSIAHAVFPDALRAFCSLVVEGRGCGRLIESLGALPGKLKDR